MRRRVRNVKRHVMAVAAAVRRAGAGRFHPASSARPAPPSTRRWLHRHRPHRHPFLAVAILGDVIAGVVIELTGATRRTCAAAAGAGANTHRNPVRPITILVDIVGGVVLESPLKPCRVAAHSESPGREQRKQEKNNEKPC